MEESLSLLDLIFKGNELVFVSNKTKSKKKKKILNAF